MTFSGDRGQQPSAPGDTNSLVSNLAGGLNTVSGDLALPQGDSPTVINCEISDAGHPKTRDGSKSHIDITNVSNVAGTVSADYTSKGGKNLLLVKVLDFLLIYELQTSEEKDVTTFRLLLTKLNVWSSAASGIKPDYVVTNEEDDRIIFTSGINAPVQVKFVEFNNVLTEASAFTTITIAGNAKFARASATNLILWLDNTIVTPSNISYVSGTQTLTLTIPSQPAGTYAVTVIQITWQWFCQGIMLNGNQVYQSVTRFNATIADQTVAIPIDLLRNINEIGTDKRWPILVYKSSDRGDYYTLQADRAPTVWDAYTYSNGVVFVSSITNDEVVPGISHITFGAVRNEAPTENIDDPQEVHIIRGIVLDFDDDATDYVHTDVTVIVDSNTASRVTSASIGSDTSVFGESFIGRVNPVGAGTSWFSGTSIAGASSNFKVVTFDASVQVGVPSSTVIEIIYTKVPTGFIGTAAVSTVDQAAPDDGFPVPAFGIQEHSSYVAGSFPRTVALYQGRLVFGGFPADPLRIITSEVVGTSPTLANFVNYSIFWENLEQTDPVLTRISTDQNNAFVSAMDVLIGNLFVFTTQKAFRLSGGSSVLSPTNVLVNTVSDVGCVNAQSIIGVENSLVFLSLAGVYRLAPSLEIGDFNVSLLSRKVNTQMKSRRNISVAWLTFDRINNRLYVGVTNLSSAVVATELYVFSFTRQAWFQYSAFYGYWYCSSSTFIDLGFPYLVFTMPWSATATSGDISLVTHPYFFPIDFGREGLASSVSTSYNVVQDSITVTNNEVRDTYSTSNFRMFPYVNFEDVGVTLDGIRLTFLSDFVKIDETQIDINTVFSIGASLVIFPINREGQYPFVLYIDNIIQENTTWTTAINSGMIALTPASVNDNSIIRIGFSIPSFYSTPVFVRNDIRRRTLSQDGFVVIKNVDYQDKYQEADVNTTVSQDSSALIGNWKRNVNLGISKVVSPFDVFNSPVVENALGSSSLFWDLGSFDSDASAKQLQTYSRIGVSLKGTQVFFQMYLFSYSSEATVFELIAYQVEALNVGGNSKF